MVVDLTVVVAVAPEFQVIYDRLSAREWLQDEVSAQYREVIGMWCGRRVQLLQCGLGPVTFSKNLERSRLESQDAHLLGVCGALREGLACGDLIGASDIVEETSGQSLKDFPEVSAEVQLCRYLCCDRIAETGAVKQQLREKWACDVVDMESFYFLQWCRNLGIAAKVLKVISDDVLQDLPPLNGARNADGEYDLAAMAKIWRAWKSSQHNNENASENLYFSLQRLAQYFESKYLGSMAL